MVSLALKRDYTFNLADFFPDCVLPNCSDTQLGENGRSLPHQHILPHQQDILDCTTKYLYCQGGVGSAKTVAFAAKAVWLSTTIPNNRGIVSRFDWDNLYDSSWRDIKSTITRLVEKDIIPEPEYSKKVAGDYTHILFHNGSEIRAAQGKNLSRGLGASHGWFWVDDAMESLEAFFIGNETNAGLLSRLRLPEIHFDRRTYHADDRPHGSLHGMVSSNPPPINHWLHKLFGNKPGIHYIGNDPNESVTWMQVATSANPFTGTTYSGGLAAIQRQMGRSERNVRRIVHGESIPAYGGIPVFPQFDHARHIAPLKVRKDLPVIVGVDFGYIHPAATFSNAYKCKYNTWHYFTTSEVTECFNDTVHVFYKSHLEPHIKRLYEGCHLLWGGDRAGYRASSSNKDKRGDMKILMYEYHIPFKWRYLSLAPSLQFMRELLNPKIPCKCGLERILISNKCPVLIGALEGGYKYPDSKESTSDDVKPVEDRYFADPACAWRYGAENFIRFGLSWEEQVAQRQLTQAQHLPTSHLPESPLTWLEKTDRELVKLISS